MKTSATAWSSEIFFSETICSCPTPEATFFSVSVALDFVCILSVNKGFTVFQNVKKVGYNWGSYEKKETSYIKGAFLYALPLQ